MLTNRRSAIIALPMALIEGATFYAVFHSCGIAIPMALLLCMVGTLVLRSISFYVTMATVESIVSSGFEERKDTLLLKIIPVISITLLVLVTIGYTGVYGYVIYAYSWKLFFLLMAAVTVSASISSVILLYMLTKRE